MNEPTIFTKIVRGDIPSHKIYEDAHTFAFLDIHPKTPGHVLVVPKTEVEFVWDLSEADYSALMQAAKMIGSHIREVLGAEYVGMMVEGLGVPHAHVHVFPFSSEDDYHARPDLSAEPDHAALAVMAEKLRLEDKQ